ncbi:DUF3575 domain-containing protein [Saccharicrinis sp. FJH54]|uniref:DUF3575 domain-containing protein n=1 Tax=Saccharicrinis sp. FJH54 TaxID=3344665 RepID=UPI0035D4EB6F
MKTRSVKVKLLLAMVLCTGLFTVNVFAENGFYSMRNDSVPRDKDQRFAINMCPGGIALGIYSANFEYLIKPKHGIVARIDYEMIPKTYSDANLETSGMAFILNYRYHMCGGMNSFFVGSFYRYRSYQGNGTLDAGSFDFKIPEITVGANLGKRWSWKSGFNITFALGYGYAMDWQKINNNVDGAVAAIDVFRNEYDFINGFLGEFSIGYAF